MENNTRKSDIYDSKVERYMEVECWSKWKSQQLGDSLSAKALSGKLNEAF